MKTIILVLLLGLSAMTLPAAAQTSSVSANALSQRSVDRITKEVRHELLLLPYYGVFDFLAYKVSPDGTVTLIGQVARTSLKSDAENAVKHVEGVERVDNQIQELPASSMDDQIRRAAFHTIYGDPQLSKYSWKAVQSIHIIVNNGHITLEGVVDSEADKNVAGLRANSVPNTFSVNNDLVVTGGK